VLGSGTMICMSLLIRKVSPGAMVVSTFVRPGNVSWSRSGIIREGGGKSVVKLVYGYWKGFSLLMVCGRRVDRFLHIAVGARFMYGVRVCKDNRLAAHVGRI